MTSAGYPNKKRGCTVWEQIRNKVGCCLSEDARGNPREYITCNGIIIYDGYHISLLDVCCCWLETSKPSSGGKVLRVSLDDLECINKIVFL